MSASDVLSDSVHSAVQTGAKHGRVRKLYINAAIGGTGAPTVTRAATDGETTLTRTSAGLYAVANLPTKGAIRVLLSGGSIINNDGSADVAGGRIVTWSDINLSAGTANILVTAGDDGSNEDSASGTTLQAFLELACGT